MPIYVWTLKHESSPPNTHARSLPHGVSIYNRPRPVAPWVRKAIMSRTRKQSHYDRMRKQADERCVDIVILNKKSRGKRPLQRILKDAGFRRVRRKDGYHIWKRPLPARCLVPDEMPTKTIRTKTTGSEGMVAMTEKDRVMIVNAALAMSAGCARWRMRQ